MYSVEGIYSFLFKKKKLNEFHIRTYNNENTDIMFTLNITVEVNVLKKKYAMRNINTLRNTLFN